MSRDYICGIMMDPCCDDYYYGCSRDECYSYAEPCQIAYVRRTSDNKKKKKSASKTKAC